LPLPTHPIHTALNDAHRAHIGKICAQLVVNAGSEIMDVRRAVPHVRYKSDKSPVCEADERAEAIILAGLEKHFPDIPVIAEEAFCAQPHIQVQPHERFFWLMHWTAPRTLSPVKTDSPSILL